MPDCPASAIPGEELVAAAHQAGHPVICIPGPCAATTALVSSGLPSGRFCFEGFLPAKGKERRARLEAISHEPRTTVLYEAPHRLITLLEELQHHCGGDRPLQVARELTKRHEEQVGPTVDRALLHFQQHRPRGMHGCAGRSTVAERRRTRRRRPAQAAAGVAGRGCKRQRRCTATGPDHRVSRRRLYALLHQGTSN